MNLVIVVQVKSLKNAVVPYKIKAKKKINKIIEILIIVIFFFEFNISLNLVTGN